MEPEEFAAFGNALYGRRWKTPLARALGMSRFMIHRYSNGRYPVPKVVSLALQALRQQKIEELNHATDAERPG